MVEQLTPETRPAVAARTRPVNQVRQAFDALPKPVREGLVFAHRLSLDVVDAILGRREDLVPPRRLSFVGSGDYVKLGDEFLQHFKDLGQLRPDQDVLDVGCGIGRMARPLTQYLTTGSYVGIDIVPHGIGWCQRHISGRYPRFAFQLADVFSKEYNPTGRFQATDYQFPFPDATFDFAFLTSVFTHMLPSDMEQYLREVTRCLRPGGKCMITFFLLNDESRQLIRGERSSIVFNFPAGDNCWVRNPGTPEEAVAYDESRIQTLYSQLGLGLRACEYGAWCGRPQYRSYQDIVVAEKIRKPAKSAPC
jgi:ubiquinone/menaquinone biosynthesis C-methylase UbiE